MSVAIGIIACALGVGLIAIISIFVSVRLQLDGKRPSRNDCDWWFDEIERKEHAMFVIMMVETIVAVVGPAVVFVATFVLPNCH